jgi:hypothetical protein
MSAHATACLVFRACVLAWHAALLLHCHLHFLLIHILARPDCACAAVTGSGFARPASDLMDTQLLCTLGTTCCCVCAQAAPGVGTACVVCACLQAFYYATAFNQNVASWNTANALSLSAVYPSHRMHARRPRGSLERRSLRMSAAPCARHASFGSLLHYYCIALAPARASTLFSYFNARRGARYTLYVAPCLELSAVFVH